MLPTRQGPKLYASNDGSHSGTGTPMGFQRYPQNKHLEGALGDGASRPRFPSPQPTHLGIPAASPHRVLSEEDPGYIAAKFEGKQVQMEQGEFFIFFLSLATVHAGGGIVEKPMGY